MKLKTMLMMLLGTTAVLAAPAFADGRNHQRGWGHGHGNGHGHGHWKHHRHYRGAHLSHYHAPRPVVVVPPRVVYAPAPVYYAPAPVYHAPAYGSAHGAVHGSGVSIRFNLPL